MEQTSLSLFPAKKIPEYLNDAVIYQVFPRMFTPRGTLKSAEKLLPHIKALGADIVYLCPVFVQDAGEDRTYWSGNQARHGFFDNPQNPYRIADYNHVDPEYGTDDDLKDFIRASHALGLRVMLDLVYFHCGPNAVFLAEHPDFIRRNEDGTPKVGIWHFPELDFDNPALREYLWDNMVTLVRDFGCDGFRTDVADRVPLDFWVEGRRRLKRIKPDIVMLNEGRRKEDQMEAYDINYYFADDDVPGRGCLARALQNHFDAVYYKTMYDKYMEEYVSDGGLTLLSYDNHDYASGGIGMENRRDLLLPPAAMDAVWFHMFTMRGVPFIYNGNEVADTRQHCIYSNRTHAANMGIEWENALTERGQARLAMARSLIAMRKAIPALSCRGSMRFVTAFTPDGTEDPRVLSYLREYEGERYLAVILLSDAEAVSVRIPGLTPEAVSVRAQGCTVSTEDAAVLHFSSPFGFALFRL